MSANWRYLKYVARHKWFVLLAGWGRVGLWRLLVHDWSKFGYLEWTAYRDFFYGPHQDAVALSPSGGRAKAPAGVAYRFDLAWLHHQRVNDHHWQHWVHIRNAAGYTSHENAAQHNILLKDDGGRIDYSVGLTEDCELIPRPIPEACREEMLADWRGAGRAVGRPDTAGWYRRNRDNMILHPETRAWIEDQLGVCE